MLTRPRFRYGVQAEVVPPEHVLLLSEAGHTLLTGRLYALVAPLLDGRLDADAIVERLEGQATPAEVYYALTLLEQKGYVTEALDGLPDGPAAFWDALDVVPALAAERLRDATVAVAVVGDAPAGALEAALAALGVRTGDDGDLWVVVTDDYLQDGLAGFNVAALERERSWLLVKPVGRMLWLGPIFRPGTTGCWSCLAQRLRDNRAVESFLQARSNSAAPFAVARAALPSTVETAVQMAATETARWIATGGQSSLEGTLLTLDLTTLESRKHTLVRQPQCQSCGSEAERARVAQPLSLRSQRKQSSTDGGYRACPPEETLARYEQHVSPFTGVVRHLERLPVADASSLLCVYSAGFTPGLRHESPADLRRWLQRTNSGKGMTDIQARASGLCEAIERYSGVFRGDEHVRTASFEELGDDAIHPNACMSFSTAQYERAEQINTRGNWAHFVPRPFDTTARVDWAPVWSMTYDRFKYVPAAYCYYGYPMTPETAYCWADSNGNAAGSTLEDAVLQGLLELVERDSVALWWYNRVRRPGVHLDSFDEPYLARLRSFYASLGRDLCVLDITADLGIPAFAALSRQTGAEAERILFGFGAHLDARIGVLRAVTELNQALASVFLAEDGRRPPAIADDPDLGSWWETATVAAQPYLLPDEERPPRTAGAYPRVASHDILDDVKYCRGIVERQGMEVLVLDQTRLDVGLPVVKVIVPGLRHFWPRFGPGRLYEAPVRLGWLAAPLREGELNPIAVFS